jgi:hypothetical protein
MALVSGPFRAPTLMAGDPLAASESQVKAAFLVTFPKYVDWPAGALAQSDSPIVLAVFGEADLTKDVQQMIEGKKINGHPLVFRHVSAAEECAQGCNILFVGAAERPQIAAILTRLHGLSILTVGDSDEFLELGGVINLTRRDRKIRLNVNLTAAHEAHLLISSRLLAVADVVQGKSD